MTIIYLHVHRLQTAITATGDLLFYHHYPVERGIVRVCPLRTGAAP